VTPDREPRSGHGFTTLPVVTVGAIVVRFGGARPPGDGAGRLQGEIRLMQRTMLPRFMLRAIAFGSAVALVVAVPATASATPKTTESSLYIGRTSDASTGGNPDGARQVTRSDALGPPLDDGRDWSRRLRSS
jgi:hypothetical protein